MCAGLPPLSPAPAGQDGKSTSQVDSPDDNVPIFAVDHNNFVTWSHMSFDTFEYKKFKIPSDGNITTLWSYFVIAIII